MTPRIAGVGAAARGGRQPSLRRLMTRPTAIASVGWLAIVVVAVSAASLIEPQGPNNQNLTQALSGPSAAHWLGTDGLGRDVLTRLLYGGRVTLLGVVEAVAVFWIAGVTAGIVAGYRGGATDRAVGRVAELLLSLPAIVIALVVVSVFNDSQSAAMITFGLLGAAGLSRVIRSVTLTVREQPYVEAARVTGLSTRQILWRHVLPRTTSVIIVQGSLYAGVALILETGLAFLGFGPQPPNPSWGGMVADASNVISRQAWLLVPPGVTIALTVIAFGMLGNAARDALSENWAARQNASRRGSRPGRGSLVEPDATDAEIKVISPNDPLLSVRGLSIEIASGEHRTNVVQNVSFDVRRGEIVGVVGESGSGKTLTALGIMRLLPGPATLRGGACLLNGNDLFGMPERQLSRLRGRKIAYISQEPMSSLDPTCTVGRLLGEAVKRHRRDTAKPLRSTVLALLQRVQLPDPEAAARRYPHQLSGGMAQRVAIALALAGEPEIIIADEPTTALDVTVQADILDLLRNLCSEQGTSILLVTHDLGVVADLCDWALVMYAGQIVESAAVEELFRQPSHPYTAALLAANPYLSAGSGELRSIPGAVPPPDEWPASCHFQPRCPYATPECEARPVPMTAPTAVRLSRCIHHDRLHSPTGVTP